MSAETASKSKQMRDEADFQRQLAVDNAHLLHEIALRLAPAFRDKFDFSEPKQFKAWADLSWQGAEAMLERHQAAIREASADHGKAIEKADQQELKESKEAKP